MLVKNQILTMVNPLRQSTFHVSRIVKTVLLFLIMGSFASLLAEVTTEFVGTPWNDKIGANTNRTVRLTNNTSKKLNVKGVRFSVPENTAMKTGTMDGSTKLKANDPWHGDRRYDVKLKYSIGAGASSGATIKGGGATEKIDWSPYDPQVLVKTRSFADMSDFVDANPVTVDQIDSIIGEDDYYDADLYVSDTLGENAPLFGAGFIDTYIKQKDSTPITQVQMNEFDEDLYIKLSIGYNVKYRPDLMGENDKVQGKDNGPGPLYCMGLVAAQELMHIDQQFLAPMGIIETQAGFEAYGVMGDGSIGARIGMTHIQKNDYAIGMGPMHMEGTGFAEKAFGSYPTFFPYASGGSPEQWFTTPGTETSGNNLGDCSGNSAQIVNATMLATLYCWRGYEQLFLATDFFAKGIFEEAKDRKLAAKLYMWGWNAGFGSSKGQTYSKPLYWDNIKDIDDITPLISGSTNYVPKVMPAVDGIIEAQKNSVLNGGTSKVIDMPLTLAEIAECLYGNNTPPYNSVSIAQSGNLGKGGILQHFPLTSDERKQLWSDIETAYNKMKGKAPSGYSDAVSFRYDWLTILRVAKGYIYPEMFDVPFKPVMLPTPTDRIFNNWVNVHSTENNIPDIPEKDTTFPNLLIENLDVSGDGDFIIELRGGDNVALDTLDPLTAEWSIDPDWKRWMPGTYVSGTKTDARFQLMIPVDTIKNNFGENDGKGWVRITDKSGNSTIDTITIGGIPYPKVDSIFIVDTKGDGVGDKIDVYLTKGGSDKADELADWEEVKYSWPDKSSFKTAVGNVNLSGSVLSITEDDYDDGAGLGELLLSYPSKKNYGGDIEDRIGPALVRKANLYPSEDGSKPDTLAFSFSEAVSGLSNGTVQLAFSESKSDSNGISAEEVIVVSEDSARYLFNAGDLTAAKYAWVKIKVAGGIVDKSPAANVPHEKNQWIPIIDNRAKYPTLDSAEVYDTDGNGTADSVKIFLTKSNSAEAYDLDDYTDLQYSWPTKGALGSVSSTVVDGDALFFGGLINKDGAGLGLISILYEDMVEAAEVDISDKVGPVITSATLSIEDDSRDKDTLLITTSEELANFADEDKVYTFLKKGTNEAKSESKKIERVNATTYKVIYDRDKVIDKDSVRFTYEEGLTDVVDNRPMDINQAVEIIIIGGKEPLISSALMFDIDGDGRGDSVAVTLQLGSAVDKYTTDDIDTGMYSWPGTSLSEELSKADLLSKSDDAFSFHYDSKAEKGTGLLRLEFPEGYSTEKGIEDNVGPVIDKATCFQTDSDRDKDTLVLTVSESLRNNFSDGTKYVILFENESDSDGDTLVVESVTMDDLEVTMIVAKSAVTYGDWIQFVFDSGIEDEAGNAPLPINQKVQITVLGSVAPTVTSASIYDAHGDADRLDGNGDSIYVELQLTTDPKALTVDSLKRVEYIWNGSTKSKDSNELVRLSDNKFAIVDKSLTGGSGTGTVTLHFNEVAFETSGTIEDNVAPVLKEATFFAWDDAKDTLNVVFSEELNKTGSDTPIIRSGDKILQLRKQSHDGTNVTYSVEGSESLSFGDEIWIKGNEEIVDTKDNEQATDENVRISINYFHVAVLEKAEYRETDTRPDGYIDEIILNFQSDLDESILSVVEDALSLPNARNFTVEDVEQYDDKIRLSVSQNKDLTEANTAVIESDEIAISYTAGTDTLILISREAIAIEDKLAPVIVSARFHPAANKKDGKLIDTLRVTYSENVKKKSVDEPFTLSDASEGDDEYQLTLSGDKSGKESVDYYSTYKKSNVLPGAGDSIWIDADGEIVDEFDNVQESNTIPVPLTVGKYPHDFVVAVAPLPFDMKHYDDSVITIYILPGTRKLPADISAKAVIYDNVGNVIKKIDASDFGEIEDESLTYEFKPKNRNNRKLGEGTYPVIIVTTTEGDASRHDKKIAIKGIQPGAKSDEKDEE